VTVARCDETDETVPIRQPEATTGWSTTIPSADPRSTSMDCSKLALPRSTTCAATLGMPAR
jgi:hypothetical protein